MSALCSERESRYLHVYETQPYERRPRKYQDDDDRSDSKENGDTGGAHVVCDASPINQQPNADDFRLVQQPPLPTHYRPIQCIDTICIAIAIASVRTWHINITCTGILPWRRKPHQITTGEG